MWLRMPAEAIEDADDVRDPREIQRRLAQGQIEVPPVWIKHPETGEAFYVTHPAHQRRLLTEGGERTHAPEDAPVEIGGQVETAAPARKR